MLTIINITVLGVGGWYHLKWPLTKSQRSWCAWCRTERLLLKWDVIWEM